MLGFTYTLYKQAQNSERHNAIVLHSYEVIRHARMVILSAGDIETGQRGYLLTRSAEFLDPYHSGLKRIDEQVAELKEKMAGRPYQLKRLSDISLKIQSWKRELAMQVDRFETAEGAPISVGDLRYAKALMDDVRTTFDDFVNRERNYLSEQIQLLRDQQKKYILTLFVGAAFALIALLVANLIIIKVAAKVKATENKLHDFQETYRMLLENLNDGVYDFFPMLGRLEHSIAYAQMLGYEAHELSNEVESAKALIHPDDLEKTLQVFEDYKLGKSTYYSNTFRMRHKDGSWRWILSRGVGTWDEKGNLVRLLGVHTDITDQKRIEEELRQLNKDLEGFIYIVSHDLRAPLVNLKGFASEVEHAINEVLPYLKKNLSSIEKEDARKISQLLDEEIPESLGFIRSGVERMDTLTSSILDLSRVGARDYQTEMVCTELIVKRCIESLTYEMTRKNVEVTHDVLPDIEADTLALEQVFGNIIDNAVKYLDESRPGKIHVGVKQLPWETVFSIRDNGRGIEGKDYQKVFDIFRRASNAGEVRGAGMGMAFVKAVVRKMGGRIWFDSVIGQGTTFYFSIPRPQSRTAMIRAA